MGCQLTSLGAKINLKGQKNKHFLTCKVKKTGAYA